MNSGEFGDDRAAARICVVKLGGSLLALADWAPRLRCWLNSETAARSDTHFVLIVGGGLLVDALRDLDAHSPLGDEAAHWAAIRIMDATAGIVAAHLAEFDSCDCFERLLERTSRPGEATIFHPYRFMFEVEPRASGTKLPASWDVTSDSIAGRLASILSADELVLIKSPLVAGSVRLDVRQLATAGIVDAFLPQLERELPNLRISTI